MSDNILSSLNKQQLSAVEAIEGYVRVIAGAGSGKTKTLTSRFVYLVQQLGVASSSILCVTFTNKAAKEMKKRILSIVGEDLDLSMVTTYHGFCVLFLREEINRIEYPRQFIIADVEDQKTILRNVFKELKLSSKDLTFKNALRYISKKKKSPDYLDYVVNRSPIRGRTTEEKVFKLYIERQHRNFALDFDDLLNFTVYILEKYQEVLVKWQKKVHYILVDETQDSSDTQFGIISRLADYHKNLFVVGDPDQTIYEWRGAKPEYLVDFDKIYPDCQTIIMNHNYRSTANILNFANQIIRQNKIRIDKDLVTQNLQGENVIYFHGKSEFEEADWISKEIKFLVDTRKMRYSDIAILYRASHVSRIVEQTFIKENIPYTLFGSVKFFERREIKDILAYLRLVAFQDDISFLRVFNTPRRGLGDRFLDNLLNAAKIERKSLINTLKENINQKDFYRDGAIELINLVDELGFLLGTKSISDFTSYVLEKTGLLEYYRHDGDDDRLDNIRELVSSMLIMEGDESFVRVDEYLQEISLYTDIDFVDEENDKVKLMTIHISKGLEFPCVFLCGFSDGIMPSERSIRERKERAIEEERRLAYVAVTRAEKRLYLTDSEGFSFSIDSNKIPSRFLFELDEGLYIQKGEFSDEVLRTIKSKFLKNSKKKNKKGFLVDDVIMHPFFKKGKIIEKDDDKSEYLIYFFDIGKERSIDYSFSQMKLVEREKEMIDEPVPRELRLDFIVSDLESLEGVVVGNDDVLPLSKESDLKKVIENLERDGGESGESYGTEAEENGAAGIGEEAFDEELKEGGDEAVEDYIIEIESVDNEGVVREVAGELVGDNERMGSEGNDIKENGDETVGEEASGESGEGSSKNIGSYSKIEDSGSEELPMYEDSRLEVESKHLTENVAENIIEGLEVDMDKMVVDITMGIGESVFERTEEIYDEVVGEEACKEVINSDYIKNREEESNEENINKREGESKELIVVSRRKESNQEEPKRERKKWWNLFGW